MDIYGKLTEELGIQRWQAEAAVKLIDEGNTIPFISRYRKEVTGSLNDEVLRNLFERLNYLRNLEEKKEQVLSSIEEQGKLTEELKAQILAAETLVVVSSEEADTGYNCEGKGTGGACRYHTFAGNRSIHREGGGGLLKRRKRSDKCVGCSERREGYSCGDGFG